MKPALIFALVFMGSITFGFAQQKEFRKLEKGGLSPESLEEFVQEYPDFAPAWLKLGDVLDKKQPGRAIECYEVVLPMIDDEEVEENAKFYEEYKQRDFRSGKYVLKADYIREHIEEKIEDNKAEL
jgi:hypothetical protein